ncbi:MAG: hypothetical protein LUF02_06755, partial [Erysipelotrichaceae bacterium]|nr:hypothetical protein [Erysipelotrichaceae bacterium]
YSIPYLIGCPTSLFDAYVKLDTANVPRGNRWVVVPPWYHGLLLLDDRFVGYGTERNSDVLQNGAIGRAAGFTIYLSNNVPNTDGTLYKIIAGTNQAGSYAEQILENEAYRPESRFADAMKGLHVYGAQVFQSKCIAVLTANAE